MLKNPAFGADRRNVEPILNVFPVNDLVLLSRNDHNSFVAPRADDGGDIGLHGIFLKRRKLRIITSFQISMNDSLNFLDCGWLPFFHVVKPLTVPETVSERSVDSLCASIPTLSLPRGREPL